MELVIQKCGATNCEPVVWQNEGACWGLCKEEKTSICIRCNPKLCFETQTFVLREITLYLCERIIWVYWGWGIVRVTVHRLCIPILLVKFIMLWPVDIV